MVSAHSAGVCARFGGGPFGMCVCFGPVRGLGAEDWHMFPSLVEYVCPPAQDVGTIVFISRVTTLVAKSQIYNNNLLIIL